MLIVTSINTLPCPALSYIVVLLYEFVLCVSADRKNNLLPHPGDDLKARLFLLVDLQARYDFT